MKTVVVGLSGGVDSSVSAFLLKEQGYRVIGLFMKNWDEENCPATKDWEDASRVAEHLDIPHYAVSFSKEYWENVFAHFIKGYAAGHTPNPDILCNREIKFKLLFDKAMELGGDYLATGHYAQVGPGGVLLRGADPEKDQSYFLYTLKSELLGKILFPIGHLLKSEVRNLAKKAGLVTFSKKDSTGICFIGKRNFRPFLSQYISKKPGHFETPEGKVVGEHEGISFYTIGQRKGLKIGGAGKAWFVVQKDPARNVITVVQGDDHPLLFGKALKVTDLSWVGKIPTLPFRCTAKIRYRQSDSVCLIFERDGKTYVLFDKAQKAITPLQSIVFYDKNSCLGGGIIHEKVSDSIFTCDRDSISIFGE